MKKALLVIAKELANRGFDFSLPVSDATVEKVVVSLPGVEAEFTVKFFNGSLCISTSLSDAGAYARKILTVHDQPTESQLDTAAHRYNVMFCGALSEGTTFGAQNGQLVLYRSFKGMPMPKDVVAAVMLLHADARVFSFSMKA